MTRQEKLDLLEDLAGHLEQAHGDAREARLYNMADAIDDMLHEVNASVAAITGALRDEWDNDLRGMARDYRRDTA